MMAMPDPMLAVVAENTPVVAAVDLPVDERKIEGSTFSLRIPPDFPAQFPVPPPPRYLVRFIHRLDEPRRRHDRLYHSWSRALHLGIADPGGRRKGGGQGGGRVVP